MKEEFLHYLWKYGSFEKGPVIADTGEQILVVHPGEHNTDAGPDFFNAKIKIDETLWVGNVEIHVKSSDWYKHKHELDNAYNNVILQVVHKNDFPVTRTSGQIIPTIELNINRDLYDKYLNLIGNREWIACESQLFKVDPFFIKHWLQTVLVERLESRSLEIFSGLQQNKNDWDETFYQHLAKNFGFKLNAQPFEQLAKSLPYQYIAKHRDNLHQIEAMFFGQAGMLEDLFSADRYYMELKKEYTFLRKKFSLRPMGAHHWKFLRLRPYNFPTIRIAQFSALLHKSSRIFSKIIQCNNYKELSLLFSTSPSDYWETHYVFHKESKKKRKRIGEDAFHNIVINTVVPFLFVYGQKKNLAEFRERAIEILEEIPPEKNSVITKWKKLGVKPDNAFYTQALLQLKNNYCKLKRCIHCRIGDKIISNTGS